MLSWLIKQGWHCGNKPSASELSVIRAILPFHDGRSDRLFAQAMNAPEVERNLLGTHAYMMTIPYVTDSSWLIDLDKDVDSPVLEVPESKNQARLRFHVSLLRGGFLRCLHGEAIGEHSWNTQWSIDPVQLERAATKFPQTWIPPNLSEAEYARILQTLEEWLGLATGTLARHDRARLVVRPPCSQALVAAVESREQLSLPQFYRDFLQITNGLELRVGRPFVIAGDEDIRNVVVEMEHRGPLALVTDLYEDGAVLIRADESGDPMLYLFQPSEDSLKAISTLREYIIENLRLLE